MPESSVTTDRKLIENHRPQDQKALDLFLNFCSYAQQQNDPGQLARYLVSLLQDRAGYDFLAVYKKVGNSLQLLAHHGGELPQSRPLDESLIARSVMTGDPIRACRNQSDPPFKSLSDQAESVLCVPIYEGELVFGAITVESQDAHLLVESEAQLLLILSGAVSLSLQNLRLHEELHRRVATFAALHAGSLDPGSTLSEEALLQRFTERAQQVIGSRAGAIFLYDTNQESLVARALTGDIDFELKQLNDLKESTLARALEQKVTTFRTGMTGSPATNGSNHLFADFPIASTPLLVKGAAIGVLVLIMNEDHDFVPEEKYLIGLLANQISTAIENRQLFQVERKQKKLAEIQINFSYRLMEAETVERAVDVLLSTLDQICNYDAASTILLTPGNSDQGYIAAVSGYRDPEHALHRILPIEQFPLLRQLQQERAPIYFADVLEEPRWKPGEQPDLGEVRSILLIPLLYDQRSELIGCLTLKSYQVGAFSREIRDNLTLLCNQTGSALRNLRLYEETRRRVTELTVLTELSEKLNQTIDLDEMLRLVLDRAISIIEQKTAPGVTGEIILRRFPSDELYIAVSRSLSPEKVEEFNRTSFRAQDGTFSRSILKGEWVELSGKDAILAHTVWPDTIIDIGFDALLNVPLRAGDDVIGVISSNRVVHDPSTRRLLGAFANLGGAAIQKSRLLAQARSQAVELMSAYEQLNEMDRQRDEFIQNMTHDLRAPLTFVRGYAELMYESAMGDVNEEQQEALGIIIDRTDAVLLLINEILKSKEIESQPLEEEEIHIEEIAHSAVRSALMTARKMGLEITLEISSAKNLVQGDAGRISQVFDNLLSNAIKFSPSGGEILVRVRQRESKVQVEVLDEGIGIPEDELEQIWQRYYRVRGTEEEYSGTGLGLPNVRRIIEAHGGRIWASNRNPGTIFTFELHLLSTETQTNPS